MKFKITHTYSVTSEVNIPQIDSSTDLRLKLDAEQDIARARTLASIRALDHIVQAHSTTKAKYEAEPFSE